MHDVSLITSSGLVSFIDKKNVGHEVTVEGALFKGGAALTALKDAALSLALAKAHNGKYRAAFDVLCASFPSRYKAYCKLYSTEAWANKTEFASFLHAMEGAEPGKNGWTKKQIEGRSLMAALRGIPAFVRAVEESEVVEMAE